MEGKPSSYDLARACHQIVDAASALAANVELLAEKARPSQQDLVEDARASVKRIAKLARAIRAAIEGKKVNLASLAPPPPRPSKISGASRPR